MGLRFRKSIRVIPGVRLNLSASGLSATLGPRGASVNVGRRGVFANAGLPGSGLSFRSRLDSGGSGVATPRTTYREMVRLQKELERNQARLAALEEHAQHEAEIERLVGVLRARVTDPFDWEETWRPRVWQPAAFTEPAKPFSRKSIAADARHSAPIWPAVLLAVAAPAAYALTTPPTQDTLAIIVACGVALVLVTMICQLIRRRRLRAARLEELEEEHGRNVATARASFKQSEGARRRDWDTEEEFRARMLTAPAREDAEALSDALEAELSDEDLPVPLIFELEFESIARVRIEIALPDLDEVPAEKTTITATGKLSRRAMAQRDRTAIYEDLCAGLVLRVAYETLRVIPTVDSIELAGTTEGVDPATGHPREFVALRLLTSRAALDRLDLDNVDPSAALDRLGGEFALKRSGKLEALEVNRG